MNTSYDFNDDPKKPLPIEGEKAHTICDEILSSPDYQKHPDAFGLWKEDKKWIAFDNRTCDCWIEEFTNKKDAMKWLTAP